MSSSEAHQLTPAAGAVLREFPIKASRCVFEIGVLHEPSQGGQQIRRVLPTGPIAEIAHVDEFCEGVDRFFRNSGN